MRITKIMMCWCILMILILMVGCTGNGDVNNLNEQIQSLQNEGIEVFGTVENHKTENVIIDIPGYVETVYLNGDSQVCKGDKILKLDLKEYNKLILNKQSELKIKQFELDNKQLELENVQVNDKLIEDQVNRMEELLSEEKSNMKQEKDPDVLVAINDYQIANANCDYLKKQYEANKKLFEKNMISESEYLEIKNNYQEAQKSMIKAELNIEIIKKKKNESINELSCDLSAKKIELAEIQSKNSVDINGNRKIIMEEISVLKRDIESLEAIYNKLNIVNGWVIAKANGVVSELEYSSGDKLVAGKIAYKFFNDEDKYIKANVPEEFIKDIFIGQEAKVTPIADKSKVYQGKIVQIYDIAKVRNGETVIPVIIDLDELDQFLLLNFNVNVELQKKGSEQ